MKPERPHDELHTLAALYALGALDGEDAREFQAHLEDCAVCREETRAFQVVVDGLALSPPPAPPRPHVRERLMARVSQRATGRATPADAQVWKMWTASQFQPRGAVRADEGGWQEIGVEGVTVKKLFVDDLTRSVAMLIRMQPGAQYPAHHHGGTEQCYVIEGDLQVGDEVFTAGDYRYARGDSIDEVSSTVSGCLLFLLSSQQDELLA